jgi:hypothetical protein
LTVIQAECERTAAWESGTFTALRPVRMEWQARSAPVVVLLHQPGKVGRLLACRGLADDLSSGLPDSGEFGNCPSSDSLLELAGRQLQTTCAARRKARTR